MPTQDIGFVIMQIGNPELDKVYELAIYPAIDAAGLRPVRIDKHNEGGLLKSEIVKHLESASIIVADLTNERPNCYLEIGYAMGLDKFKNLILSAREDHHFDNPNYKKEGPKIHFDLSGYDISFWNPDNLEKFKKDLIQKIKRRLFLIKPKSQNQSLIHWSSEWLSEKREYIEERIQELGIIGFMEVRSSILNKDVSISQSDLLMKAHDSLIDNFGWPIGIVFLEGDMKPAPKADGIESDIANDDNNRTYDYSYYKKNGQFYTATSHFEDSKNTNLLIVPTRISRITEAFMFLARYYSNIGLSFNDSLEITIRHTGLRGRLLREANNYITRIERYSNEDEVEITLQVTISDIENELVELVAQVIDPLLVLFDFHKIEKGVLASYVNRFVNGKN